MVHYLLFHLNYIRDILHFLPFHSYTQDYTTSRLGCVGDVSSPAGGTGQRFSDCQESGLKTTNHMMGGLVGMGKALGPWRAWTISLSLSHTQTFCMQCTCLVSLSLYFSSAPLQEKHRHHHHLLLLLHLPARGQATAGPMASGSPHSPWEVCVSLDVCACVCARPCVSLRDRDCCFTNQLLLLFPV